MTNSNLIQSSGPAFYRNASGSVYLYGYVNEYGFAHRNTNLTLTTSATAQTLASVTLSGGSWLVSATVWWSQNTSSWTLIEANINQSSTASTVTIDANYANYVARTVDSNTVTESLVIPAYYQPLGVSTTVYLKVRATWTGTAPIVRGIIQAIKLT